MSEIQDNEILADCAWFADKHRGKNKQSGPYWSTVIRFPKLYDEAIRLQKRVDTLEDYIADYCSPITSDKYSEIERQAQRIAELEHYKKLNEQWVKEKIDGLTTLEEIEKMVMIADRINKSNASIRCGWCDAEFETRDEVKEHAYGCKDNPLAQRIEELEQERRWIPVSERLPEEGQPVLIDFGNNEITVGIWFWENEPEEWSNGTDYVGWQHWDYRWDKFFPSDEPPLHWQPLPQPTKEGE